MPRIYYITRNLGRMSVSKIDFIESARSFPDFFIKQNGKKGQNFQFGKKKRVQNGKNSRNFQFGKKKRVQNGKKGQNFHFGKEKRVQNGKKGRNFHFEIRGKPPDS